MANISMKCSNDLLDNLKVLGFVETPSNPSKLICTIKNYSIKVNLCVNNLDDSTIDYGGKIIVHHKGVCNFQKRESFVQLECVIRLLSKGYKANCIELEKTYRLGHNDSGRLDVLIKKGKRAWAMIECKTYGHEYDEEKNKLLSNGGQIFTYYVQDRSAEIIGIYSSKIENDSANYISEQIQTKNLDKNGNIDDIFSSWDKKFINAGIFDNDSGIYEIGRINLRKKDLISLTKESGKSLFNDFEEILRKHVVSDKSNAFNVIFNLFVCKIYDEDIKSFEEELDFQKKISDDETSLMERLSSLYKNSVGKYLSLKIDEKYFSTEKKIALKEFQFIDVYNDETFEQNSKILSEVVSILQKYRIKYSTRHQFLGDFFEKLLNTGVKQEAGQFFTPIPLTRFILKSLPIKSIINNKISAKEPYILPHIIDYACGAGHFLTESIEEINSHFDIIDPQKLSGQQSRFFEGTKNNYLWAKDYIYGIEKDHRLAKTTKIAMFLNGDGDATILSGDGLDDFHFSNTYSGLLKSQKPCQTLGTFDIVASNPPFSVPGFYNTVNNPKYNFSSHKYASDKSQEIECFFIERALQLLKEDGVCGLILPISFLYSKKEIYIHARKLLLLFSKIVSIVELGDKTFVATNTCPCVIFFRKRHYKEIASGLSNLSSHKLKGTEAINTLKKILETYKQQGVISPDILDNSSSNELIEEMIKEQQIVIAYSGEKKRQEFFLGYRYSNSRDRAGVTWLKKSLLYNFSGKSCDTLDVLIQNAFNDNYSQAPSGELEKHSKIINFLDIVNISSDIIDIARPSSLIAKKMIEIKSISPFGDFIDEIENIEINLNEYINNGSIKILSGLNYDKDADEVPEETNIKVLTASNIDLTTGKLIFGNKMIHLRNDFSLEDKSDLQIKKNDIIMSMSSGSLKQLGKVAYAEKDYNKMLAGGFLNIIRVNDEKLSKALFYRFMSKSFREFVFSKKGQNINNLNMPEIIRNPIKIPRDLNLFNQMCLEREQ